MFTFDFKLKASLRNILSLESFGITNSVSLPTFPDMRPFSIDDQEKVEAIAKKMPAYSTFNFTNSWSWDVYENRQIAQLNGNIVIKYSDYASHAPFLTFLGTKKPNETASELLHFANENGFIKELRFIPEHTAQLLTQKYFSLTEDVDNNEYVYSIKNIAEPTGNKLKTKRMLSKRFTRDNPTAHFEIARISQETAYEEIMHVFNKWKERKTLAKKTYESSLEEIAITRLAKSAHKFNVILSYVTVDDHMIGFSVDEIVHDKYVIGHFIKADTSYKGVYEYLNQNIAKYLKSLNREYWNWQQDLGIPGLRQVKLSYGPVNLLKKYTVTLK